MLDTALNHMTAASASCDALLSMAVDCGCRGIELRNDLAEPLFGLSSAYEVGREASRRGLTIHALAEVPAFNQINDDVRARTLLLAQQAQACGATGIVLIPANDGKVLKKEERIEQLTDALSELLPILKQHQVVGFVEPLGFRSSSLRYKADVVAVIESLNAHKHIQLIHDTFHHYLAAEAGFYPEHTGLVHISGVIDTDLTPDQMKDGHRVLVNQHDQLQNIAQLQALVHGGYSAPVSMEVFATEVQRSSDLATELRDSFSFIHSALAAEVA